VLLLKGAVGVVCGVHPEAP